VFGCPYHARCRSSDLSPSIPPLWDALHRCLEHEALIRTLRSGRIERRSRRARSTQTRSGSLRPLATNASVTSPSNSISYMANRQPLLARLMPIRFRISSESLISCQQTAPVRDIYLSFLFDDVRNYMVSKSPVDILRTDARPSTINALNLEMRSTHKY
jgi:hypothetical protein